jgi:hypothetical protein
LMEVQLQACCAAAMYPQGGPHAEAAVHLVQSLLQPGGTHPLPEALQVYAQAAADKQQWAAAARAAVQLVAHAPSDTDGARLLAHAAQVCGISKQAPCGVLWQVCSVLLPCCPTDLPVVCLAVGRLDLIE